jgi:hypothetical protein
VQFLIIPLMLAAANRYAGINKPFNKELFGISVMLACWLLGFPLEVCAASGLLGYAGRQFISHGAVYQVEAGTASAALGGLYASPVRP